MGRRAYATLCQDRARSRTLQRKCTAYALWRATDPVGFLRHVRLFIHAVGDLVKDVKGARPMTSVKDLTNRNRYCQKFFYELENYKGRSVRVLVG